MWRLSNRSMGYAWGSTTAIPEFLGEEVHGEPVAELWIGTHPKAPSMLLGFDGQDVSLIDAIEAHPDLLGDDVVARFGARLPFLVKLLAAGTPLSLQVHPDAAMAERGYAREQEQGLSMEAAERTYKDPFHKPEVMVALEHTETLAGFRPVGEMAQYLSTIGGAWADRVAGQLDNRDLRPALGALLDGEAWAAHGDAVVERCRELAPLDRAYALVGVLQQHFPGDSGVVAPLMLNVVDYREGEALFVPTGQVHAHVQGFGIEVMAASDNVIRAGLTPKHVDRDALFAAIIPLPQRPQLQSVSRDVREAGAEEFTAGLRGAGHRLEREGPKIVLALEDGTVVGPEILRRGESLFVAHGEDPELTRGRACVVLVPPLRRSLDD